MELNLVECQFAGEVLDFLQNQADKAVDIGTFIGSSEILESFFGIFKNMEGDQCKSGFTGLVLAAHAHIGELKEETVIEALSTVKTRQINEWTKVQVGTTIQSQRKKIFQLAKNVLNKILGQESTGIPEGEVMGF